MKKRYRTKTAINEMIIINMRIVLFLIFRSIGFFCFVLFLVLPDLNRKKRKFFCVKRIGKRIRV